MALGGGNFTAQNKVLPGTYMNFVSLASADAKLSERGIVTMPLELDWGVDGEVFTVTRRDFQEYSRKIFGYDYDSDKLKGLRDLFRGATVLHAYRLNTGGTKASNKYAEAKYTGICGNEIKIIIQQNLDKDSLFDVRTMYGIQTVDTQTVADANALVSNDYVDFKQDAELEVTASAPLTGGTNGVVDGGSYQAYLDKIESYTFNALGVVTTDQKINALVAAFSRRMRDEVGMKFQAVVYRSAADYMGVVNVKNSTADAGWPEASLVYWVTGIIGGCEVNKSNQNKEYDGEFAVDTSYTQTELIEAIESGEFTLHGVNGKICVLEDINSKVTISETEGDVFKENQTIRVIDQLANDDAVLFRTRYMGLVPNNKSGRVSLWSDLTKIRKALLDLGAIEDFEDSDMTVEQGEGKKSVVVSCSITVVIAMSKLYMTTVVA